MHSLRLLRLLEFPYFENYLELGIIEHQALEVGPGSQMVFVGGGPLPLSAIVWALIELARDRGILQKFMEAASLTQSSERRTQLTSILTVLSRLEYQGSFQVTVIDMLDHATHQAQEVLRSLGLSGIVRAEQGDGTTFMLPGYVEAVAIASMAEPKDKILENLMSQRASGQPVRILVRSVQPSNLRRLLYEPVPSSLLNDLLARHPNARFTKEFEPPSGSRLINSFSIIEMGINRTHAPNELTNILGPN